MRLRATSSSVTGGGTRRTDIVRAIFRDGTPGTHFIVEEAMRANEAAKGPELLGNGWGVPPGFDNTLTDVTPTGVTTVAGTSQSRAATILQGALNVDSVVLIKGRVKALPASGTLQCYARNGALVGGGTVLASSPALSAGWFYFFFTAASSAANVMLATSLNGQTFAVDSLSVREINLSKCAAWQDGAGSVPVVLPEQPLGLIMDASRPIVLGPELVTNGTNPATTAYWTPQGGAVLGVAGGGITVTGTGSAARAEQTGVVSGIGKWYLVTAFVELGAGVTGAQINYAKTSDGSSIASAPVTATGPTRLMVQGVESTCQIKLRVSTGTGTVTFKSVSVREVPGVHLSQPANTTARPVVRRRVNLFDASEELTNVAWTAAAATPVGSLVTESASGALLRRTNGVSVGAGVSHDAVFLLARGNTDWIRVIVADSSGLGTNGYRAWVNLSTGAVGTAAAFGAGVSGSVVECSGIGSGRYLLRVRFSFVAAGSVFAGICSAGADGGVSRANVGDGPGIGVTYRLHGADLRLTSDAVASLPAYQAVRTPTDYDEIGFPAYLFVDGVDDWLESGPMDMTSRSEVTVVAGLAKSSDTSSGMVVEFGPGVSTTNGSFDMQAYGSTVKFEEKGSTSYVFAQSTAVAADKLVLTGEGCISDDVARVRVNGAVAASSSGDQGVATMSSQKLYVGSRAGTGLRFKGRIYGLTVIGKTLSASQLQALERRHKKQVGAY